MNKREAAGCESVPRLWSDFDGTAVITASKFDPRNWLKYPLRGIEGYNEFLGGVRSTGVEIAGVVTRRPDVWPRRLVTGWSISSLAFTELPTAPERLVHTGSEERKGRFIVAQSQEAPVGMLEDNPHRLGSVILGALREPLLHPDISYHPVTIGVVAHPRSQEHIERLMGQAERIMPGEVQVHTIEDTGVSGFVLHADSFNLEVVQLEPYSRLAGEAFGRQLMR